MEKEKETKEQVAFYSEWGGGALKKISQGIEATKEKARNRILLFYTQGPCSYHLTSLEGSSRGVGAIMGSGGVGYAEDLKRVP